MKKGNLLSKAEMKKVIGGNNSYNCTKHIVCDDQNGGYVEILSKCCTDWQTATNSCHSLGYSTGMHGCIGAPEAPEFD